MKTVIAVMGYGCNLTQAHQNYLREAAGMQEGILLLCGGVTNHKTNPRKAEAKVMADFLQEEVGVSKREMRQLRKGLTTEGNLLEVKEWFEGWIWKKKIEGMRAEKNGHLLLIWCDWSRQLKIRILGRMILGWWPRVKTFDLVGGTFPPGWPTRKEKAKQILVATPLAILAFKFGWFAKMQNWLRARKMARS